MSDTLKFVPIVLGVALLAGVAIWSRLVYNNITQQLQDAETATPWQAPEVSAFGDQVSPFGDQPRGLGSGAPEDDWRNGPLFKK